MLNATNMAVGIPGKRWISEMSNYADVHYLPLLGCKNPRSEARGRVSSLSRPRRNLAADLHVRRWNQRFAIREYRELTSIDRQESRHALRQIACHYQSREALPHAVVDLSDRHRHR